jgi:hypothetical protein
MHNVSGVSRRFNAVYALLWRVLQDSPNGARTTLTLKRVRSILFNGLNMVRAAVLNDYFSIYDKLYFA